MSASDFSFPDHTPLSVDEVVAGASQEVQDTCQGNVKCIFDATQTGNMDVGLNTMQMEEVFMEDQIIACEQNSIATGDKQILGWKVASKLSQDKVTTWDVWHWK